MRELPIDTDICKCSKCEKVFNSTTAFDKHRTGSHKLDSRRCMSTEEMLEQGMRLNNRNRWISQSRIEY